MPPTDWRDLLADLATGSSCVGCGSPGRLLCRACAEGLPVRVAPAWPDPAPPGLVAPWAATAYADLVRDLVVGHKERGRSAHAPLLGRLLALACGGLLAAQVGSARRGPVLLVPVPSRPGIDRSRGHAPMRMLARHAARALAGATPVEVVALVRHRGGVRDQAGLDVRARAANLAGALACDSRRLATVARRTPRATVVVVDDVITTGATLAEAQRALAAAGVPVLGAAVVAATPRRLPPGRG